MDEEVDASAVMDADSNKADQIGTAWYIGIEKSCRAMKAHRSKPRPSSEIAMFGRLIQAVKGDLDPRLARYVLTLGFPPSDQERMNELAARNHNGALTEAENDELESYVRSGHLLALLRSKARKSLKRRRAS